MQLDLFGDWLRMEREQRLQSALIEVRDKYGPNSILSGTSYLDGATQRERNEQIGGHRKG
jgi:DNA polymerase V